jgi:integrase
MPDQTPDVPATTQVLELDRPDRADLVVAATDRNAIETWLASYTTRSAHTSRNFRREAERFLMWLDATKGPSDRLLPAATADDANRYLDFLGAPRPFKTELLVRYNRTEQPFRGPLARASMRQAIVILHGMFEALRNVPDEDGGSYIRMNPWVLVRDAATGEEDDEIEEALTFEEWDAVQQTIENLPRETARDRAHYARTRWIFQLLYRAFLRREEASALLMGSFENGPDGWRIKLLGKGRKIARIVASRKLIAELTAYRQFLGLPPLPAPGEDRPAILAVIGKEKPISDQAIYAICTTIFRMTADRLAETDAAAAARLRCATPHWMRHTGISHAMERGVDPRYVQAQARHSSLNVTARYDHKEKRRWRDQLEMM